MNVQIFPVICVIILAVLGLGYYTVHKMNPGSFRMRTSVWRLFSFDVEIGSAVHVGRTAMTSRRRCRDASC